MQSHEIAPAARSIWFRCASWLVFLVVLGILAYAIGSHLVRAGRGSAKLPPAPASVSIAPGGPVNTQVIESRASDKYEYLADVLKQLASHPTATCRDEVAGSQGLQDQLAQASALKMQGKAQDADLVLVALKNRLDRKFKMECLKLE